MSYSQIVNQDLAYKLIKASWDNKTLASSYLFWGPRGTGRSELACLLAKALNCQKNTFPPCMVCDACRRIEKNNHPDVHYIRKENSQNIKIEQIKQMQKEISLHSFEGRYKVFIIFNSEDLTAEAANSLLKILEEPPKGSLIILIVSDLRRVFSTISSRCQKIRFNSKSPHQAQEILNHDFKLNKDLSHFLAFNFEGRIGEALKFKDKNILEEKNRIIRYFMGQPDLLFSELDFRDKEKLVWVLKILVNCIRDIYLLKIGVDRIELINQDIADELSGLADKFSFSDLYNMLREFCDSKELIRDNVNPRLLLDNLRLLWKKS